MANCAPNDYVGYAEFHESIYRQAINKRIPISGSFEVTYRCNFACHHCFCNLPLNDIPAKRQEMSLAEIKDAIDQITAKGCLWLLFTGGEVFVRDDFADIYIYAREKGLVASINTNALWLDEKMIRVLTKYRPYVIEITLYGHDEKSYRRVTQSANACARVLENLAKIKESGLPFRLKTPLMTLTRDNFWDIKKIADQYDVPLRYDPNIHPRNDGSKKPTKFRLPADEVVRLDHQYSYVMDSMALYYYDREHMDVNEINQYLYRCGAGRTMFHLNPYGQVSICMSSLPSVRFSLKDYTFAEIWDEKFPPIINQTVEKQPNHLCSHPLVCDNCPALNYLENQSLMENVPYYCEISDKRWQAVHENVGL